MVLYNISIQPNAHSHIDPKIMAVDFHYFSLITRTIQEYPNIEIL